MNVIFVSSRGRGTVQNRTRGDTVHISVPYELVMGLLAQGAILQIQISPVPLRPDLARPAPRPDSANTTPGTANTNTRPDTANPNTRPDAANTNARPDSERSQANLNRPERPATGAHLQGLFHHILTDPPCQIKQKLYLFTVTIVIITLYQDPLLMNLIPQGLIQWRSQRIGIQPQLRRHQKVNMQNLLELYFLTFLLTLETMLEPGIHMQGQELL